MRALIVGASGYNGRRVAERLTEQGHWVRGLVRDGRQIPTGLDDVVIGDVATGAGLDTALDEVDVAYYFVHSLDASNQDVCDRTAAQAFVRAAQASKLQRGVFFTTLPVPAGVAPPRYQRNRLAVQRALLGGIPGMVAVRAGMVIAAKSRGFRPYLQLVQRAPFIPMGPWRRHRIAVVDPGTTTDCLVRAGTADLGLDRVLDVPASAEPTHEDLVRAVMAALHRTVPIVPLPWTSPVLDALLTSRITDDSFHFSRHLASINRYDYVVDCDRAARFADVTPLSLADALQLALRDERPRQLRSW